MSVKIFLSTVSDEFRDYRDQLRSDLTRHNVEVKVQEDFKDYGVVTLDKLDLYIRSCDAVVHLVGDMTGSDAKPASTASIKTKYPDIADRLPPLREPLEQGLGISYSQWEAWLALYHGKVLLIAKADDAAPRGPNHVTSDASRAAQQMHLQRLRAVEHYPGITFTSPDNLAKQIAYTTILDLLAQDQRGEQPREPRGRVSEATSQLIDYRRLPETFYQRLIGRDVELRRLDESWLDPRINIASLIAEGGAGKSALVNEWLKRLQADNYRGAETVLGWSFYSQGTKESATSAEEFLNWALAKLEVTLTTNSVSAKAEALAEAIMRRRVLLVLDGVEPLQHGPAAQPGELKDFGLRVLLRSFATAPPKAGHGLVVLTSRLVVKDIARWQDGVAPVFRVERLSDETGAALLRENGVWGTDKELKDAVHDFGGHPLALGLLASYLKETQTGDVRRRDHIRSIIADPENPGHDHARRVMESYERNWLANQPVLLSIMHIVGLFDRPISEGCLGALCKKPAIKGLTDEIVGLSDAEWQRAVSRLREIHLLAPMDHSAPSALDAHPLLREWFGARLRAEKESAWRAAHFVIYDYLRRTTREGDTPTIEQLAPLYQAIAHGCQANLHGEVLHRIYIKRFCRWRLDKRLKFHSKHFLGAFGADLAALSWFFAQPYDTPLESLDEHDRLWILGEVGWCLTAQGRFREALQVMRTSLPKLESRKEWINASIRAANLSDVELLMGNIGDAIQMGSQSVSSADKSDDDINKVSKRAVYATALLAAGRRDEAKRTFVEAEQRQRKCEPHHPLLYSTHGYQYCDFLLTNGEFAKARDRSSQVLAWFDDRSSGPGVDYPLLSRAFDHLALGRAHLGLALSSADTGELLLNGRAARVWLNEALDEFRQGSEIGCTPCGLIARAAFGRSMGNWESASRDLDEVSEIAELGPMRLFMCDMRLERVRLCFARIEAFAPLTGVLDHDRPGEPAAPSVSEAVRLREAARLNLVEARKLIADCGYHKRDEELAQLETVLAGSRRFAELPPRA
jgi:tetratricopeptide (TPR) repeat protein